MPTLRKASKPKHRLINRENRLDIYLSAKWQKLRIVKLANCPLCELCLQKEIIKPAIDIHHKDSFTNYTGLARIAKAYDYNNLLSVCKECHSELHRYGTTHG